MPRRVGTDGMSGQTWSPPFPWFGGKSRASNLIWERFGDVEQYIEPFFGSGAVLFKRPTTPRYEVINDADGFVANFWRAVKSDPDEVARWAVWPCSEVDLLARHRWLCEVTRKRDFLESMKCDPEYYDARIAGYWCWGLCYWIGGGGWCSGWWDGEKRENVKPVGSKIPSQRRGAGVGVTKTEKAISNRKPLVTDKSIHEKRPAIRKGAGVSGRPKNRAACWNVRPHLTGEQGIARRSESSDWFDDNDTLGYLRAIAERLRRVKIVCGDWARVCTRGVTSSFRSHGILLDPPYSPEVGRDPDIYRCEWTPEMRDDLVTWCLEHERDYRIALCGLEGEYNLHGWEIVEWNAANGYGKNGNRKRERIWFSPRCLKARQLGLFE